MESVQPVPQDVPSAARLQPVLSALYLPLPMAMDLVLALPDTSSPPTLSDSANSALNIVLLVLLHLSVLAVRPTSSSSTTNAPAQLVDILTPLANVCHASTGAVSARMPLPVRFVKLLSFFKEAAVCLDADLVTISLVSLVWLALKDVPPVLMPTSAPSARLDVVPTTVSAT